VWSGENTEDLFAAQDPSSFGQAWETSGDNFSAPVPSLDVNFNFDPALIDSLPDSTNIPDFFIDTPHHLSASAQHHMLTPHQTLKPPTTTTISASPSRSRSPTSSLSDDSSRSIGTSGAGRQPARPQDNPDVVLKRQRNTIAARKYRQKRLDRIQELEDALEGVTRERDDLKLRLARQEAETAALKEMMRMNSGQDRDRN